MILDRSLIDATTRRYNRMKGELRRPPPDGPRGAQFNTRQRQALRDQLAAGSEDPQIAAVRYERILAGNDLVGIAYLAQGLNAARAVGRVVLRDRSGRTVAYGTGFLVAPGVLMTNNHVLRSDLDAATALVEFEYEQDARGRDRPAVPFALEPARGFLTDRELDFSLVAVAPRSTSGTHAVTGYGWLPLRPRPGKAFVGEYLTIIQHPGGERKQICVRENKLLKYADNTLWYQTDTLGGSSGSPVFNGFWEVVALHHSGVPDTDQRGRYLTIDGKVWDPAMGEARIRWKANEGVRISSIVAFLRAGHADAPVAAPVLDAADPPFPEAAPGSRAAPTLSDDGRTLRFTVPVAVALDVGAVAAMAGDGAQTAAAPAAAAALGALASDDAAGADADPGIEAVKIDQSRIAERPGYDPDFLGPGLRVPLPRLSASKKRMAAKLKSGARDDPTLLRYYNYSVVMHRTRRLAFYSAVNIDGPTRRSSGKREGDKWYLDPRLDDKYQVGEDLYASVKFAEAKRKRIFDRGHLVRRLDATWGDTKAEAKRNGDDTFHFTNCTPQHWEFNEKKQFWAGIEDFVLASVENRDRRACVISGPVFRRNDDKRAGVAIPRQFYKVIAFAKDGKLTAAGFLLSQAELLARDLPPELRPLKPEEAKVYQVPISRITRLTGLGFGPLAKADAAMRAFERAGVALQPLEDLTQIVL